MTDTRPPDHDDPLVRELRDEANSLDKAIGESAVFDPIIRLIQADYRRAAARIRSLEAALQRLVEAGTWFGNCWINYQTSEDAAEQMPAAAAAMRDALAAASALLRYAAEAFEDGRELDHAFLVEQTRIARAISSSRSPHSSSVSRMK